MRIFPEMWASTLCPFSSSTGTWRWEGLDDRALEDDRVFLGLRQNRSSNGAPGTGSQALWLRPRQTNTRTASPSSAGWQGYRRPSGPTNLPVFRLVTDDRSLS